MIPLRHYRYLQGNSDTLIMFIHGGGFILGSLDSHDDICAELCANTGYDLVSVDYRLSPEHFHPTHLDDVEDAFNACRHAHTILSVLRPEAPWQRRCAIAWDQTTISPQGRC